MRSVGNTGGKERALCRRFSVLFSGTLSKEAGVPGVKRTRAVEGDESRSAACLALAMERPARTAIPGAGSTPSPARGHSTVALKGTRASVGHH